MIFSSPAASCSRCAENPPIQAVQISGTTSLRVVPEFLGNRTPFADPHARANISGLGMDRDLSSLTALYVAGLCGKGYGLRQIIEAQDKAGAPIDGIAISGGAGQSDLVRQILAEATGKPVVAVGTEEPVLLGSAMLAACAAGAVGNLAEGMSRMSQASRACVPAPGNVRKLHDDRYAASCALQSTARTIRETKAR